ncbi:hypothetical protein TanjilG_21603 [Lupinus angustifolius]|uniref:Uncharacterized protein n=1 Tax=Lupinus angustifolius TaxID=3871 RepID=A0A4P1QUN2_LUPAN|nr:PREDICTED: translocator protein homolog [Lupinus angustifolius]OIV95213.1 hypothetical protein TanjilG_21603 [Lupinus angustifolius]
MAPHQALRETKKAQAKRALRSLAIAIAVPVTLNIGVIILCGSGHKYHQLAKPIWFAPLWFIHLATLGSSFFMGLAAWLVWADGVFKLEPDALPLYVAQVSLSIVWEPLVVNAHWLALVSSIVNFGTLFMCYLRFRKVNPFAKDLAKPCLLWAGYLTLVSFKLMFL